MMLAFKDKQMPLPHRRMLRKHCRMLPSHRPTLRKHWQTLLLHRRMRLRPLPMLLLRKLRLMPLFPTPLSQLQASFWWGLEMPPMCLWMWDRRVRF
jgi:hypothetical protein